MIGRYNTALARPKGINSTDRFLLQDEEKRPSIDMRIGTDGRDQWKLLFF